MFPSLHPPLTPTDFTSGDMKRGLAPLPVELASIRPESKKDLGAGVFKLPLISRWLNTPLSVLYNVFFSILTAF